MRSICCSILLLATCSVCVGQSTDKKVEFKSNKEKVSYAIGINVARQFKQQGIDLDVEKFALGVTATLQDLDPALTAEEIQKAFEAFEAERAAERKKLAATNMAAAKKFLEENAKKPGVKTTKSGLQYKVLKEGTGATPTSDNTVSTHYRGKLLSGKVFDESYKEDSPTGAEQPVSFGVTQVISGWTEALQLMKEGAKYRLFIKPELAYGENGPGSIGPNSLLIFDIELMGIK